MAGSRRAWQGRAAAAALTIATAAPAALHFAGPATSTPAAPAPGPAVAGPARVIDGDTLAVGAVRVRLLGVDAPEHDQTCGAAGAPWPCGAAAARRLGELAAGGVRCSGRDHDRYGRLVARCDAGGVDLGGRLVAEGLAWAFVRYSDAYVAAEAAARARHAGLWAGDAEAPWDYRAGGFVAASGTRAAPAAAAAASEPAAEGACRIKGNVGAGGRRVYHLPGDPSYARTRIDPARGEAWFCDAAAAEAAGFVPARPR
ncbi:MAG: thermonuclease family protein [Amaricoccus sp.]